MQKNIKKLKKFDKKRLNILDRFLTILWRKEVEYKINILIKAFLKNISYESSNKIPNLNFYFPHII